MSNSQVNWNWERGDKVVRTGCSHPEHGIVSGGVYTIKDLLAGEGNSLADICLEEDPERYYDSNRFDLYVPTELEEAYAHIETLESALEDAVNEILSLKHQLIAKAANTCLGIEKEEPEFKPINEMTLEDWELAKREKWLFMLNNGKEVFVKGIMEDYTDHTHPIELNDFQGGDHEGTVTVQGHFYLGHPEHSSSVKQRIK